jgi:hypothetical protein
MRRERGDLQSPPYGLREAVLRVSCEERADHRRPRSRFAVLTFARACARLELASVEDWCALQRLCGVPADKIGPIK